MAEGTYKLSYYIEPEIDDAAINNIINRINQLDEKTSEAMSSGAIDALKNINNALVAKLGKIGKLTDTKNLEKAVETLNNIKLITNEITKIDKKYVIDFEFKGTGVKSIKDIEKTSSMLQKRINGTATAIQTAITEMGNKSYEKALEGLKSEVKKTFEILEGDISTENLEKYLNALAKLKAVEAGKNGQKNIEINSKEIKQLKNNSNLMDSLGITEQDLTALWGNYINNKQAISEIQTRFVKEINAEGKKISKQVKPLSDLLGGSSIIDTDKILSSIKKLNSELNSVTFDLSEVVSVEDMNEEELDNYYDKVLRAREIMMQLNDLYARAGINKYAKSNIFSVDDMQEVISDLYDNEYDVTLKEKLEQNISKYRIADVSEGDAEKLKELLNLLNEITKQIQHINMINIEGGEADKSTLYAPYESEENGLITLSEISKERQKVIAILKGMGVDLKDGSGYTDVSTEAFDDMMSVAEKDVTETIHKVKELENELSSLYAKLADAEKKIEDVSNENKELKEQIFEHDNKGGQINTPAEGGKGSDNGNESVPSSELKGLYDSIKNLQTRMNAAEATLKDIPKGMEGIKKLAQQIEKFAKNFDANGNLVKSDVTAGELASKLEALNTSFNEKLNKKIEEITAKANTAAVEELNAVKNQQPADKMVAIESNTDAKIENSKAVQNSDASVVAAEAEAIDEETASIKANTEATKENNTAESQNVSTSIEEKRTDIEKLVAEYNELIEKAQKYNSIEKGKNATTSLIDVIEKIQTATNEYRELIKVATGTESDFSAGGYSSEKISDSLQGAKADLSEFEKAESVYTKLVNLTNQYNETEKNHVDASQYTDGQQLQYLDDKNKRLTNLRDILTEITSLLHNQDNASAFEIIPLSQINSLKLNDKKGAASLFDETALTDLSERLNARYNKNTQNKQTIVDKNAEKEELKKTAKQAENAIREYATKYESIISQSITKANFKKAKQTLNDFANSIEAALSVYEKLKGEKEFSENFFNNATSLWNKAKDAALDLDAIKSYTGNEEAIAAVQLKYSKTLQERKKKEDEVAEAARKRQEAEKQAASSENNRTTIDYSEENSARKENVNIINEQIDAEKRLAELKSKSASGDKLSSDELNEYKNLRQKMSVIIPQNTGVNSPAMNSSASAEITDINKIKVAVEELKKAFEAKTAAIINEKDVMNAASVSEVNDIDKINVSITNLAEQIKAIPPLSVLIEGQNAVLPISLKPADGTVAALRNEIEAAINSPEISVNNIKCGQTTPLTETVKNAIQTALNDVKLTIKSENIKLADKLTIDGVELGNEFVSKLRDEINNAIKSSSIKSVSVNFDLPEDNILSPKVEHLKALVQQFEELKTNVKTYQEAINGISKDLPNVLKVNEKAIEKINNNCKSTLRTIETITSKLGNSKKRTKQPKVKDNFKAQLSTVSPVDFNNPEKAAKDYLNKVSKIMGKFMHSDKYSVSMETYLKNQYQGLLQLIDQVYKKQTELNVNTDNDIITRISSLEREINQITNFNADDAEHELNKTLDKFNRYQSTLNARGFSGNDTDNKITEAKTQADNLLNTLLKIRLGAATPKDITGFISDISNLRTNAEQLGSEISRINFNDNLAASAENIDAKFADLLFKISQFRDKNTKIKGDSELNGQFDSLVESITMSEHTVTAWKTYTKQFNELKNVVTSKGKMGRSLGDELSYIAEKIGIKAVIGNSVYNIIDYFKQMVSIVKDIDTQMTVLKRVTDETSESYNKFLENASKRAGQLGSSISDIVNATGEFAKLGYSLDEATALGESAAIYSNVGFMDISEAISSMSSVIQAFNINAKDSMNIVDKMNEIGNRYAISSAGVGEALQRSASALVASGNDLDEAIAMITAGNTIVQDPDSVAHGLRTVALRIRGAKTELQDMGEETDTMVESTSKLRDKIKAITGVDIMLDESTFKSTYEILLEISKVYDKLSDIDRTALIEMMAGKNRSNILAAILQSPDILEDSFNTSLNSQGSAQKELNTYLDSIEGRLTKLKSSFEELSNTVVNSEVVKTVISIGDGLVQAANGALSFSSNFAPDGKWGEYFNNLKALPTIIAAISTAVSIKNHGKAEGLLGINYALCLGNRANA